MESNKNNDSRSKLLKLLNIIFMMLLLYLIVIGIYFTYEYITDLETKNNELIEQVEKRDSLIKDIKYSDSVYFSQTKNYSKKIDHYVRDCSLEMNGKKITLDELVKMLNTAYEERSQKEEENIKLQNNLNSIQYKLNVSEIIKNSLTDSFRKVNTLLYQVLKEYDLHSRVDKKTGRFIYKTSRYTKTDSALLLYPYFKQKLSRDTAVNTWLIKISPTETVRIREVWK
ncbi:MAG: hypothetical protein ACXWDO_02165 [Bacteroidia bacterium]